jgi:hypothetical protein
MDIMTSFNNHFVLRWLKPGTVIGNNTVGRPAAWFTDAFWAIFGTDDRDILYPVSNGDFG